MLVAVRILSDSLFCAEARVNLRCTFRRRGLCACASVKVRANGTSNHRCQRNICRAERHTAGGPQHCTATKRSHANLRESMGSATLLRSGARPSLLSFLNYRQGSSGSMQVLQMAATSPQSPTLNDAPKANQGPMFSHTVRAHSSSSVFRMLACALVVCSTSHQLLSFYR